VTLYFPLIYFGLAATSNKIWFNYNDNIKKQETHIDNEENKTKDEQFSILGHQVCLKRPRDDDSQSSLSWVTNSSERVVMDPGLASIYFCILKAF
jgi:hypothetical protein